MRPCDPAGLSNLADLVARFHSSDCCHVDGVHMTIQADQPMAVIQDDRIAIEK